jgi:hypothetical protein
MLTPHKLSEDAFGEDGVGYIQARELVLAGLRRNWKVPEQPVVERTVVGEFEGAD